MKCIHNISHILLDHFNVACIECKLAEADEPIRPLQRIICCEHFKNHTQKYT